MTPLRRIQRELQAYLLGAPNAAAAHVAEAGNLGAVARLQIYADAYRLRLREALEADFPALRAWLGAGRFAEAAERYIAAHPSTHYSLRWFGRHLPRFLAEAPPFAETPLLAELAQFEWALGTAGDAPDEPVLSRAALARLAPAEWPSLRLEAHPSVVRLDLLWNAPAVRQATEAAAPLPAPRRGARTTAWIVWRQDYHTYFRSLDADEAQAFDALCRGDTFAAICAGLSQYGGDAGVPARAAALLERWIGEGLVRRLRDRAGGVP